MRLRFSVFPIFPLIFASPAFAGAALPRVDVGRAVSARAMYGELAAKPRESEARSGNKAVARALDSGPKPSVRSGDVLSPRRPSGNLWASPGKEAPLRMPKADEFAVLESAAALPEESLDIKPSPAPAPAERHVLNRAPAVADGRAAVPAREIAEESIGEEEIARAFEAGRIAELQRIADKALAERAPASKTRRLVVPMNEAPRPAVTSVRSMKSSPVSEEEFAYKSPDDVPLTKLSPMQLKRAFKKTYVSENKHLSAYKASDAFDVSSDEDLSSAIQGFDSSRDLSEKGDIRPLEIKISFRGGDAALSRDNYMLLTEYAGIVASNPKRAVQVSIPEHAARSFDGRKLAAKRLAIIEQVLRDTGISDQKIVPVLADRDDDALVLRVISNDVFRSLTQNRGKKNVTTKSLAW